ncbi:replication/maintenance protein RepL [Staphylococcus epidermidis]|uniref:replication/maintenance protein RepL n=1 Tax=Staphylococcus epidermidis TaxID=1282 RepID=UPI001932EBA6|nr:replication/maintenance protein RepL [Staphylococcus epidermidis]MBM0828125.1 replication/maintenance protein RepL [Staphylococcus epidermidis]
MTHQLINLEEHTTFESIQAMDNTVRQYNAKISKTHFETLNLLKQYSCKVIGVSHIKIKTMANQLKKSVATVKRHIKYLKDNGFITVINTFRMKQGGKGANTYAINPIDVYQKIQNELSQMSHRKNAKKRNKRQSQQAMAFVKAKKETIFFIKLLSSFVSNKCTHKQIKLKRTENIKNFRACPKDVPMDVYKSYKAFFSDAQIKYIYTAITQQTTKYANINDYDHIDIVDNTFNSLVKALRKYHRGEGENIKNIFAYATGTAKKIAFRQASMNAWANVGII